MNTQVHFALADVCFDPGDNLVEAKTLEICLSSVDSREPSKGTYVSLAVTPEKLADLIGVLCEAEKAWENAMNGI